MGRIQSSVGLVTGVPIEETVNQLMALNGLPRDRLVSRNTRLQQEQVALTELTTLVVGVQLTTDRLGQASLFSATTVASSKPDAITARSTGSPQVGSYSFVPVKQAQSQQLTSSLFSSDDQRLSAGEVVIHRGGFLDQTASLDGLNGGAGVSRGRIRITDRSGTSQNIDLRFAQTAGDVVDAINANDDLRVVASLDGDHLKLTDVSGATASDLIVAEVGGGTTAADLGLAGISTADDTAHGTSIRSLSRQTALKSLLDGRGLDLPSSGTALNIQLQDGSSIDFSTSLDATKASLGQLIDGINAAGEGKLVARISGSGRSLEIEDLTSGASAFAISSSNGSLAQQLGLGGTPSNGVVSGDPLIAGLGDVLLSSLGGGNARGGNGLTALGQLTITDRSGVSDTIDLSTAKTLGDVVAAINGSSAGVQAKLNRSKTGIELVDTTGSTLNKLTIENGDATNTATQLRIEGEAAGASVDSGSLHRQYVTRNTSLKEFNGGTDLVLGSFQLTNSSGQSAVLNLTSRQPESVGDVIDAINQLNIGIKASLNSNGDGILLVDQAQGSGSLQVSDTGGGTAAQQLGLAGTAKNLTVDGSTVSGIDGSRTIRIQTTAETTLADLTEQINELGGRPLNANLLNLNSSGGVRLLLSSSVTGARGRVSIDSDVGISFSETTSGSDALIAFGATASSGGVLVTSATNTFSGLVADVELSVTGTSDKPVSVTISATKDNVTKQVEAFVNQFNTLRDKLSGLTAFDAASNSVGVLFGSNAALRVDLAFGRLFSSQQSGTGSIRSVAQLGIRLNESGKLEFNKAKFTDALAADPAAVTEFFSKEDTGFSAKAKQVADSLAGVEAGALLGRSNSIQTQIEQNNRRIESLGVRLDRQRTRLLKQFYNMESTIGKLQQNLTSLNQLQIIPPLGSSSN